MGLTKRTDSNIVYLEVKHYCLWRSLKKQVDGCDVVEVTNPKTGVKLTKYGYRFDTVSGRATRIIKYDTKDKYATRFFGFKLEMVDGTEKFSIDLPYKSQVLRRFLTVAHNIDWSLPFSITVFKGKKKEKGSEETGIWFQQRGETVRPYYTKDQPHGMPEATYDSDLEQWDFRAQQRWLAARLQDETMPDIEAAAAKFKPPVDPADQGDHEDPGFSDDEAPPQDYGGGGYAPSDEDVPFIMYDPPCI